MFITYHGTQTALNLDVQGKAIRLVPYQPVEVTATQLEILEKRPLTKIMMDKGIITIDAPKAKAAPKEVEKVATKKK